MQVLNGGAFSVYLFSKYGTFDYGETPQYFENISLSQENHIVDGGDYLYFGQVRVDNQAPCGKGIRVMKADGQWFEGWHENAEVMNGHGRWFGPVQKYYLGEFLNS
jgi:hypothetical protein